MNRESYAIELVTDLTALAVRADNCLDADPDQTSDLLSQQEDIISKLRNIIDSREIEFYSDETRASIESGITAALSSSSALKSRVSVRTDVLRSELRSLSKNARVANAYMGAGSGVHVHLNTRR